MTTAPVTARTGRSQPRVEPPPLRCAAPRRRGGVNKPARTATVELSRPTNAARVPPRAATAARALVNRSSSRILISRARSTHSVSISEACRTSHGARVR
ncbi:MAG TPA: hypothetical protein VGJ54_02185 [Streptosporangiaceae bacterium]